MRKYYSGKKDSQVIFKCEDSHCLGDLGIWGFISDVEKGINIGNKRSWYSEMGME